MIKYSIQRECILQDLVGRCDHPTADMVYESVRILQPNISLGTVYRNLSFLADSGQILKISTGNGPDHFDGCTKEHYHFVCRSCGKVLDLDYVPRENLKEDVAGTFDGVVDDFDLQFFGKCSDCC